MVMTALVAAGAIVAAFMALIVFATRWERAARRASDAALALLLRGELTEAKARFAVEAERRWFGYATNARYHLALIAMRLGDLEGARERFTKLQRTQSLGGTGLALVCVQVATCLTLLGELAAVEEWLGEADARATKNMCSRLDIDPQILFARALYDCRRGASAEVARTLQARWRELEASLTGEGFRRWRVLHAFALASSTGPRDGAHIEPLLQPLRGGQAGEFAWLGARWPEMQSFLTAYGLG